MSLSSSSSSTNPLCRWIDTILHQWPFCYETRHGTIECPCARVKYTVSSPPSSYALVEQTTAICHCDDCVGFASGCPNSQYVLTKNHGTHMTQFYACDIQYYCCPRDGSPNSKKDTGDETTTTTTTVTKSSCSIGAVKLRENTPLIRIYCKECGTPIGAQIPTAGICLVYDQVLTNYSVCFLPSIVLGFKERLLDVTKPYSTASVTVRQSNFGFIFLCRVISRVSLGLLLGKKVPTATIDAKVSNDNDESHPRQIRQGLWPFDINSSSIPVGLGSIPQKQQQQQQQQKKVN